MTNKTNISKLGSYIYQNYPEDKIGLERKYEKYAMISGGQPNESISYPKSL